MIKTFRCKETARIFKRRFSRKLPTDIQAVALRKLRMLAAARSLDDLRIPPANRLEALKGNLAGRYSIRINNQYRLCFVWRDGEAYDVEIIDYH